MIAGSWISGKLRSHIINTEICLMSLSLEKGFGMYSNSHPARYLPAPPLTSPYIPSSYGDFSDYHHPVPGFLDPLCDLPAAAWSRANAAPREDWATLSHGFPGSSPDAGPASYESTEFAALNPAFGGGACAPLTRGPGDPFTHSVISRSYEWIRDSGLPESGHGAEHRHGPTAEGSQVSGQSPRGHLWENVA